MLYASLMSSSAADEFNDFSWSERSNSLESGWLKKKVSCLADNSKYFLNTKPLTFSYEKNHISSRGFPISDCFFYSTKISLESHFKMITVDSVIKEPSV